MSNVSEYNVHHYYTKTISGVELFFFNSKGFKVGGQFDVMEIWSYPIMLRVKLCRWYPSNKKVKLCY